VLERGPGLFVYDSNGKPYIEACRGCGARAGYGNEELVERPRAKCQALLRHLFSGKSPIRDRAGRKLRKWRRCRLEVFFCNSGSEANDTQSSSSGT